MRRVKRTAVNIKPRQPYIDLSPVSSEQTPLTFNPNEFYNSG